MSFWHTCDRALVSRGSSIVNVALLTCPAVLALDMGRKVLSAFAILHSAYCILQVYMPQTGPKILLYVGGAEAGLKRGQHTVGRVGGAGWQAGRLAGRRAGRSRQNFRAVCPFSACLSPAGHEIAAKKRQRATNFSFNWAIGAATCRPDMPYHSLRLGHVLSQTAGAVAVVLASAPHACSFSPALPSSNRLMYY